MTFAFNLDPFSMRKGHRRHCGWFLVSTISRFDILNFFAKPKKLKDNISLQASECQTLSVLEMHNYLLDREHP